ncbi:MAG: SurA N-terminal domain-containing protein [Hyphomicrobiaceae bacterium]|nr:SurA N-terminal domain-containing protein [Hyphomicrobiaceae bacterium]
MATPLTPTAGNAQAFDGVRWGVMARNPCFRQPPALHMARHIMSLRPKRPIFDLSGMRRIGAAPTVTRPRRLRPEHQGRRTSMLEALRRGSQGIVVKILLAVLILSFAVWGIADVFTGFSRGSLAEVGEVQISEDDYQRAFQNELNALSYRAGRRITGEQARAFGLDAQVLNRLIGWAAVDTHADELNLALTNKAIAQGLQRDSAFHGPDGKYSPSAVDGVMRQLNLSEQGFINLRRKEELRRQITGSLAQSVVVPDAMIETLHAYSDETRVLSYIRIDPDKVVKIEPPDEAKLKQTYDANKAQFVTKPMRHLAVLLATLEGAKKRVSVSTQEAQKAYELEKASYDTPEKRRVQQIAFPDMAAAEAAKKLIEGGQSFTDAAKAAGAKESDIDLGLVTKAQLYDPKIREAAFALEKDKVSAPVEGRFTTVLLRVSDIEPGTHSTFDEVKMKVIDKLGTEKARVEMQKLHDAVEDGRAAGLPLKDIAAQNELTFIDVPATDADGNTPEGKPAMDNPMSRQIVASGFAGQVGFEQDPIEFPDGGIAWVDVVSIIPSKDQPFEDVKDEVKSLYEKNERERQLRERAEQLVKRLDGGETMQAVAADAGGANVETTPPVNRNTTPQGLSRAAIAQAFALRNGGAGSAETPDNSSRDVFQVKEIKPAPAATKEQKEQLTTELKTALENDTVSAYVSALKTRLGSSINQATFNRLRGIETP